MVFVHTAIMRAATRFSAAVLIITIVILISNDLDYIRVLQDFTYDSNFTLSQNNEVVGMKPHEVSPEDGFLTSVKEDPKTDAPRIMFVSTTTIEEETTSHIPAPDSSSLDRIVVIGQTSKENTSWVEQLDT